MRRRPLAFGFALAFAVAMLATPARADDAESLFREGIRLMDVGDFKNACERFERSQAAGPAAGTLLNLATCYERDGRRVEARETFVAARDASVLRSRWDWAKHATEHIEQLERSLAKVTIDNPTTQAITVTVDGKAIPAERAGQPLFVVPGRHTLSFSAPGFDTESLSVDMQREIVVRVPQLRATVAPPPPKPEEGTRPPPSRDRGRSPLSTVGLAVGGAGIAALAFGGISVALASAALDDVHAKCPLYPTECPSAAVSSNDRAKTWSHVATVAFVAGGALVAGGLVLWFVPARSSKSAGIAVRPLAVSFEGRW